MDIVRKSLKVGEYSPEGIKEKSKREKFEREIKCLQKEDSYWKGSEHSCPYCEKKNRLFSREGLFQHMRDGHGINLNDGGKKWRNRAKAKFIELGV